MPAANPFAPLIDVGSLSLGNAQVGDHHVSAAFLAGSLLVLVLLWKRRFRFSTKVG